MSTFLHVGWLLVRLIGHWGNKDVGPNSEVEPRGFLPPGRHPWTLDEVEKRFCQTTAFGLTRRNYVWDQFREVTEHLRSVVPVAAVWIFGSFLSSKSEPDDVDAVYIVRAKEYDQLPDPSRQAVALFNGGSLLKGKGFMVDSYVLQWSPRPSNGIETDEHAEQLMWRGYWDDWLQRHKVDRQAPASDLDALPVRGYVEVILDGFVA